VNIEEDVKLNQKILAASKLSKGHIWEQLRELN